MGSFVTQNQPAVIERAFQLAKSGRVSGLYEIRSRLRKEGYTQTEIKLHLEGLGTQRQLVLMCGKAKHESGCSSV